MTYNHKAINPDINNLITDNLDTWTTTIKAKSRTGRGANKTYELYGIKKLRELILDLAVRGLLVPQDPNDKPASELIKKIAAEKEQLIREGKIKKQKALPEIAEEEKPFEIPENWIISRVGNITSYGLTEKVDSHDVKPDTWVLELEDVEKGTSNLLCKKSSNERNFKSSKNVFNKGDVIYGKLRPYLDKVIVANESGVCTTEMMPFHSFGKLDSHFLRLSFKSPSFKIYANSSTHGMNLPRLGTDKARLAVMSVPPYNEQKRIVAKVDELMALCDQLEHQTDASIKAHKLLVENLLNALTQAKDHKTFQQAWHRIAKHFDTLFTTEHSIDQLKQTILQLAVMGKLVPQNPNDEPASELLKKIAAEKEQLIKEGKIKKQKPLPEITEEEKPFELPEGWKWVCLSDSTYFQEGPGILAKDFRDSGVPLIRIAGMHEKMVSLKGCNYLDHEMVRNKWSHFRLDKGDIILSSSASLGKISRVDDLSVGAIVYTGLIRFKPFSCLFEDYLILFFESSEFSEQINRSKTGAAIKHFGPTHLKKMIIPLPPLNEQKLIAKKVDELVVLCDQMKSKITSSKKIQTKIADSLTDFN